MPSAEARCLQTFSLVPTPKPQDKWHLLRRNGQHDENRIVLTARGAKNSTSLSMGKYGTASASTYLVASVVGAKRHLGSAVMNSNDDDMFEAIFTENLVTEQDRQAMCDACYSATRDETISTDMAPRLLEEMVTADWVMMVLVTIVIAFYVADEVTLILTLTPHLLVTSFLPHSHYSLAQVWDIDLLEHRINSMLSGMPRYGLLSISYLRRYVMLPSLLLVVPLFQMKLSPSALDIALNACAALFVLEADNLVVSQGLSAATKRMVAEAGV